MRDQSREQARSSSSDATDTPLPIRRTYMDFPAPASSSPRLGSGSTSFDARSFAAPRPQGQRLEMSPEMRERIQARASQRGAAAARAGALLRATGGRGRGRGLGGHRAGGRGDPRLRTRSNESGDEDGESEDPDQLAQMVFDRQGLPPREWVDHTPEDLSLDDLRVDWPSIPTGQVGMVESVREKLRWMSRRMQHSYNTPEELAKRMQKGKMVHFESAKEKEQVLKVLKADAEKRAELQTEDEGFEKKAKRFGFEAIGEKDRNILSKQLIQGVYPPIQGPKPHHYQFLNDVTRLLGNNETYAEAEKRQLIGTIQKLLPARRAAAPA